MQSNPFEGVAYHWIGGLAAASFYIPFKAVKKWSWETYWLVGGLFSWIIAPMLLAYLLVPDLRQIFSETDHRAIAWAFFFGLLWGVGGLTFGLSMRYLGIALGYAIALGMCAIFGTLVPPAYHHTLLRMFSNAPGRVTLLGVGVCIIGIIISGMAGTSKERELTREQKQGSISEFNFVKGMLVALFAGVLSAAMAFGLDAGSPITASAKRHLQTSGRSEIWQGLPELIVILLGGFATNFLWCIFLNIRNRSTHQYISFSIREAAETSASQAVSTFDLEKKPMSGDAVPLPASDSKPIPIFSNYLFAAIAGVTWYFQFFFYTMGSTKMGEYGFSSWTLHMASIIIFSTLWGIYFKEWKGTSGRTHRLIGTGLAVLVLSTIVVGWGNYLKAESDAKASSIRQSTPEKAEPVKEVSLLSAGSLLCEYWKNPQNVDALQPRLSWVLSSSRNDRSQSAYQIRVASRQELLDGDQADLWDSGKVASDLTGQIAYAGKPLLSEQHCFWRVRVWDQHQDLSAWSASSEWSMGLLNSQDWKASWITASTQTLPVFRKQFRVEKPLDRATIYICGLGQYELRLNGGKVGAAVLEPGWTNYHKTCLYQSYNLTDQLKPGSNVIGVMLGNGMFNVPRTTGRYEKFAGSFGPPKLIAQLELIYQDGTSQTICTDDTWKAADGPITFSNTYGGEDYDGRLEKPGFDQVDIADESRWQNATVTTGPGGRLFGTSRSAMPIIVSQTLKPVQTSHPKLDAWVYDLGQNGAQMPLITVSGPAGASVRLIPGEVLNKDGTVSQRPSGGPVYFNYLLKGGGRPEIWSPRFTYYGCRYFQVSGAIPAGSANPLNLPVISELQGRFITSDSPPAGEFSCSNSLFNQTALIIRAAMRNNMMSVLTDCPHREKLGWLEQSHLVGPSLMYSFQTPVMFTKICCDTADSQLNSGLVPDIAPEYPVFSGGFRDSPEWGSACVLLPMQLYQWYGDTAILARQYSTMQRYASYLGTLAKNNILNHGLGDWYDLGPKPPGEAQLTPRSLTATAFYYHDLTTLRQTAAILGRSNDATRYSQMADQVRDSFNQAFYHPNAHCYATGNQTANAIPLVFGLAPDADRTAIVDCIVKDIRLHNNGLTSGDVGYRYLLRALADGGRSDVIFDMNSSSDKPGYGMIIAKGATSLTEAWDARPDASQDHFMLGHIMEWFYSDLAGIQQEADSVAFKKIVIKPSPVGDINWASASFNSAAGKIVSSWRIDRDEFVLDIEIPPNTTARVIIPRRFTNSIALDGNSIAEAQEGGGSSIRVLSGVHHFVANG